jgi:trk system potassium uptake protein TrkA
MKIIIVGAGELGQFLTSTLSNDQHDIVVVDSDIEILERLKERHEVMTVAGDGAAIKSLKQADIQNARVLIAVSGDEAANLLACKIADHFQVKTTICKMHSTDFFSEEDGFLPEDLGVGNIVIPSSECVDKILNVMDNKIIVEQILYSNPNALMSVFEVQPSSPLAGLRIKDFPDIDLLNSVRFSAILRDKQYLSPYGETIIVPGDVVYVAGPREKVNEMVAWNTPESININKVVIAGASRIGKKLAIELRKRNYSVKVIENDMREGKRLLDDLGADPQIMVIQGVPTEKEVMEEAGVGSCDAFVSALNDDEENILSCIIAKKLGAGKVITVTNKSEYINIVPALDMIDCGFSSSLVALNSILRKLGTGTGMLRTDAILHSINACLYEFKITKGAPVCEKKICDCNFPLPAVLSLVFRGDEVLPATGSLVLKADDVVAVISNPETAKHLEPMFIKKGWFNL